MWILTRPGMGDAAAWANGQAVGMGDTALSAKFKIYSTHEKNEVKSVGWRIIGI